MASGRPNASNMIADAGLNGSTSNDKAACSATTIQSTSSIRHTFMDEKLNESSEAGDQARMFEELVNRVREGDDEAIETLWNDYYSRLVRVAAGRLPRSLRRTGDEEDVALSAFHSFVAGVRDDRFPDLRTPDNLWGLMITLTSRKVHAHIRRATRQKRGGGSVRGESVFIAPGGDTPGGGLGGVGAGHQNAGTNDHLAPDVQAELVEATETLMQQLDDEELQRIAWMRMDGYLVDEIAEELGRSKRAIERRLQLIRKRWHELSQSNEKSEDEPSGEETA